MKKKGILLVLLIIIGGAGEWFFHHNAAWYDQPVFEIKKIDTKTISKTQKLQSLSGQLLNKTQADLQLTHFYTVSQGDSFRLKVGDRVFLDQEKTKVTTIKRDLLVWRLVYGFICALYLFSALHFLRNLSVLGLNVGFFILCMKIYSQNSAFPLLGAVLLFSFLSIAITALLVTNQNKERLAIFLSALVGTLCAWGIGLFVLKMTHHQGIRYEEIGIVTRPYRLIYYSSLLIGTLGATTDIAVTLTATLSELLAKRPDATFQQLYLASRNVGQNILGPMANVLFFVCLSEIIPLSVLYLENNWSYGATLSSLLSLELFRALVGMLGITLTIPLSVLVGSALMRGDK